jgi:hypothetical protein
LHAKKVEKAGETTIYSVPMDANASKLHANLHRLPEGGFFRTTDSFWFPNLVSARELALGVLNNWPVAGSI